MVRINGTALEFVKTANDGSWHHVAAIFDGDAVRVYVDGKRQD